MRAVASAVPALRTARLRSFVFYRSEKERFPTGLRFLVGGGGRRRSLRNRGERTGAEGGGGKAVTMVTCDIFRAGRGAGASADGSYSGFTPALIGQKTDARGHPRTAFKRPPTPYCQMTKEYKELWPHTALALRGMCIAKKGQKCVGGGED